MVQGNPEDSDESHNFMNDCHRVREVIRESGLAFFNLDSANLWVQARLNGVMDERRISEAATYVWWSMSIAKILKSA